MAIPERNMILVAVVLAILEKFIGMLGKLNFIWATTVLLGGFGSDLLGKDFWFVSVILVPEGIRIFGRRGELHTSSYFWDSKSSYILDRVINCYSILIQEFSAVICLILFGVRYRELFVKYGRSNRNVALKLFYSVSAAESALILLGNPLKWFSGISPVLPMIFGARWISRWVLEVKKEYQLDNSQINTLYRFFHRIYSRGVSGSIFDSWKMTIVSYSVELLQSSDGDEQLKGATLLRGLVKKDPRALERLRSIRTIRSVVEMLIDMLNWDSNKFPDKLIREEAAMIISYLIGIGRDRTQVMAGIGLNRTQVMAGIGLNRTQVMDGKGRNRTLVMAAPNSIESIASLLSDGNQVEINSFFCVQGLRILCQLTSDHDNRAKMGSNRWLLLKIIALTESNAPELVLKILAIFTLTSIALDQESRESIGGTEGVLHNFFSLFFWNFNIDNNDEKELVRRAGEALGFLSLENDHNCEIMMNIKLRHFRNLIQGLINVLNDPVRGTYAARILRNLSAYLEAKSVELEAKSVQLEANRVELDANSVNLNTIRAASAEVVRIAKEEKGAHQEAAIGLTAQIFKFPPSPVVFGGEGGFPSLISKLLDVLQQYASPSEELPNIRRFSILLLIAVMKMDIRPTIGNELQRDLINALEGAMNTTSVLESYSTFSGTIGLTSHRMSIPFLAHSAMELLRSEPARRHRS